MFFEHPQEQLLNHLPEQPVYDLTIMMLNLLQKGNKTRKFIWKLV